jgi:hypothetical protein
MAGEGRWEEGMWDRLPHMITYTRWDSHTWSPTVHRWDSHIWSPTPGETPTHDHLQYTRWDSHGMITYNTWDFHTWSHTPSETLIQDHLHTKWDSTQDHFHQMRLPRTNICRPGETPTHGNLRQVSLPHMIRFIHRLRRPYTITYTGETPTHFHLN